MIVKMVKVNLDLKKETTIVRKSFFNVSMASGDTLKISTDIISTNREDSNFSGLKKSGFITLFNKKAIKGLNG